MGRTFVGTSGWVYPEWRGVYYPAGLRHREELAYLATRLSSIEINGSFYSLLRPQTYRAWYAATPASFLFAVKGSRFITHMKKLRDVDAALANFFASGVLALEDKLGPFLWQLPPQLGFDRERLARFFEALPRDTRAALRLAERHDERVRDRAWLRVEATRPLRHALEVRHDTFADPAFLELLRQHDVALCIADTAGRFPYFEDLTTDFAYVRLHGDVELYASGYDDAALDAWARKIRAFRRRGQVFVYFDNDVHAHAPRDAERLRARLAR